MKECFKCGQLKPYDEFYKHPKMSDGLLGKCKSCTKADSEARRKEKEQDLEWVAQEAKRQRQKAKRFRDEGRASPTKQESKDKWIEANKVKRLAHNQVRSAIASGRLIKQPCEVCGDTNVQAHHKNYLLPLKINWLCPTHHGKEHHEK